MLLRNLAQSQGLCNGTRLIVTKLQPNIIDAKANDLGNNLTFFYSQAAYVRNMPFK